ELQKRYGPLIAQKYQAPMYVQYIDDIVGYGAFAQEDIEPGDMIGEYTGILINELALKNYTNESGAYLMKADISINETDLAKRLYVDAIVGNFTRFISHSFSPNINIFLMQSVPCDGLMHLVFIANKPIKKDEQLFINYGIDYWKARNVIPKEFNVF